jgi:hypothetical protein
MVLVFEQSQLGLVVRGILFQPLDSLLYRAAKSGADLKSFMGGQVRNHRRLLK